MAGKKQYSVQVPLVIAKTETGDRYLYHGAVVPDEVSADEIKRLLEGEFIVAGDAPAEEPSADDKAAADKAAADKKAADDKAAADKAAADAAAAKK